MEKKPANLKNDASKLTCEKIKEFMADEKKANSVYNEMGLKEIANDESDHYKFFKKASEKKNCTIK